VNATTVIFLYRVPVVLSPAIVGAEEATQRGYANLPSIETLRSDFSNETRQGGFFVPDGAKRADVSIKLSETEIITTDPGLKKVTQTLKIHATSINQENFEFLANESANRHQGGDHICHNEINDPRKPALSDVARDQEYNMCTDKMSDAFVGYGDQMCTLNRTQKLEERCKKILYIRNLAKEIADRRQHERIWRRWAVPPPF